MFLNFPNILEYLQMFPDFALKFPKFKNTKPSIKCYFKTFKILALSAGLASLLLSKNVNSIKEKSHKNGTPQFSPHNNLIL